MFWVWLRWIMNKISVEDALKLAEQHFPSAPERLAELLQVEVRFRAFKGDGFCVKNGERAIIVINSEFPLARRRFTLAHEIGHLLLNIPSVFGETIRETQRNNSEEERRVNGIAGQILLPLKVARRAVRELPISPVTLKKLAKDARVSELFVARRLAGLAPDLGLLAAAIIHYENQKYRWQFGTSARMPGVIAEQLLFNCQNSHAQIKQIAGEKEDELVFADLIQNSYFSLQTVFLQRVRALDCATEPFEVTRKRMEDQLLENYESLRPSLQGSISGIKSKAASLTLNEAVELFNERYLNEDSRWDPLFCLRMLAPEGQDYLRLRFQPWVTSA